MLAHTERDEIYIDKNCRIRMEGPVEQLYDDNADRFDIRPLAMDQNLGRCDAYLWQVEACGLFSIVDDAAVVRSSSVQAARDDGTVFLSRWVDGAVRGLVGDQTLDSDPREIYLIENDVAMSMVQSHNSNEGIKIPKSLLGFDAARHPSLICLSKNPVTRDALHADLDQIFDGLRRRNVLDKTQFERVLATVKVAIGSDRQDGDVRRRARDAITQLICTFIEQRLEDPDLSVELILKNFGVSRASLYRMFEAKGGVWNYVRERRVLRAVMELAERPVTRGGISAVAEKWGFPSIQRFNRSVRRQFGVAPSSLVYSAT